LQTNLFGGHANKNGNLHVRPGQTTSAILEGCSLPQIKLPTAPVALDDWIWDCSLCRWIGTGIGIGIPSNVRSCWTTGAYTQLSWFQLQGGPRYSSFIMRLVRLSIWFFWPGSRFSMCAVRRSWELGARIREQGSGCRGGWMDAGCITSPCLTGCLA